MFDAPYVLGALSPGERHAYEQHLAECDRCAESVRQLAGLPGLLSRIPAAEVMGEAGGGVSVAESSRGSGSGLAADADGGPAADLPPETLLPGLLSRVRRERRRSRWLTRGVLALAAACCIVVALVALWPPGGQSSGGVVHTRAMTAVASAPISATARLADKAWGTEITLHCTDHVASGYSPGDYSLVVLDRGGDAQQISTWRDLPGRNVAVSAATSLARADISTVEVRTAAGQAILRLTNE